MSLAARHRKLERPRQWGERFFSKDSMPALGTIRKWVNESLIEGEWINGCCFVYSDQLPPRVRQRPTSTGKRTILEPEPSAVVAEFAEKLRRMGK